MQNVSPIGWALRPLKNYAKFSGRASRAEFWWFFLLAMIIYVGTLFGVTKVVTGASMNPAAEVVRGSFTASLVVVGLYWLLLFIPTLAVQIRRLHDTDRSGWWLGGFWLLYIVYMALWFSTMVSITQNPGTTPNMGSFAGTAIIGLLFFIYSIVLLVFFCLRGSHGPNRFGDDPYGANVEEVFA